MMGIDHFWIFVGAGLLLNITPGPDMLYVITRSISQGKLAGLISALSIGVGALAHVAAAALGISAILATSATAFAVVKYAGAAYLVFMGIRALCNRNSNLDTAQSGKDPLWTIFRQGLLVSALNPKVALFFLAFLPQFVQADSPAFTAQIVFLGLVFNFNGTLVNSVVALSAHAMASRVGCLSQTALARVSGCMFISLGLFAGATER